MKYNRAQTEALVAAKQHIKFLFFWGHQPSKDGSITKSCFSQWWPSAFEVDGVTYRTAEHYMMAAKAKLFNDEEHYQKIIEANHPMQAKKLGRQVLGFSPEVWDEHKYEIVKTANLNKFGQHPELKAFLLGTKNRVIVEASPRDRIWGIGMSEKNEKAQNPRSWRGKNLLGYALMEVRDQLQD